MDLNKVLTSLTEGGLSKGVLGGAAGGLLAGALLSKKGRKTAKKVAKVGGVAALGALAWSAYNNYRSKQGSENEEPAAGVQPDLPALPATAFENLDHSENVESGDDGYIILRAMIAAAMADGHIDASEQQRIFAQVNATDLSSDDKAALFEEMQHRRSAAEIAALVTDQALAIEVYLASVLAIDESAPPSELYLDQLRTALELPPALAAQVRDDVHELS